MRNVHPNLESGEFMSLVSAHRRALVRHPMERGILAEARGILLDWDGCVAVGDSILPEACRLIADASDRVAILSNNSTHLPEDIADLLARNGLSIPSERIVLAGTETIHWAASRRSARVLLLAAPRMRDYARSQGLDLVRNDADMVLLMRDARFTYAKLERAVDAISGGAQLVAANPDRTHPGPGRRLVPETGALLAALMACVPSAEVLTIGKPGPLLFEKACAALRVAPQDAVMVGDNPETDGAGAAALGIPSIIVGARSGLGIGDLIA
jgi:4-nitrophenyl phosphatase